MAAAADIRHMRHALALAARGLGRTAPNPAVGCVIVTADGCIAGRGWTAPGGRPHAETQALAQAGRAARGASVYVTLEPCAHYGKTPPCAQALIEARVARVVVAVTDPDPRVNGKGLALLRAAGIAVTEGICAAAATELNAGFFLTRRENRPLVTLKLAASLDGKIAAADGSSRWITGGEARRYGHLMRARHDAIMIGVGTALADDPELTCRLPGLENRSPVRVVLDSMLRLPGWSKLAQTARQIPVLVYTSANPDSEEAAALIRQNVLVVPVARDGRGRPDLSAVLADLAGRGITRVLAEGGAGLAASLLDRGFADRVLRFSAPLALGAGGTDGFGALSALSLEEAPRFIRRDMRQLGTDMLESFIARG